LLFGGQAVRLKFMDDVIAHPLQTLQVTVVAVRTELGEKLDVVVKVLL
jgi:hypothetical protein